MNTLDQSLLVFEKISTKGKKSAYIYIHAHTYTFSKFDLEKTKLSNRIFMQKLKLTLG